MRSFSAYLATEFGAVHARHLIVRYDNLNCFTRQHLHCPCRVGSSANVMTVAFESQLQRREVSCIVVDQKKVCHDFGFHVIFPGLALMDDVVRIAALR
ncbi:hypothetical protein CI15_25305 [Paraburkholderia monticola]|uniref:Uncharacterized protein n=1 Tax=Paraburkholderia monticola TaxID=1399968 RepID=A0A149PFL0_9BURK|nr:hypothetical protein [Paraburkholderia monticola]KXU83855.1 hypothetical protein CI15_25305 [Paraburkholderia monticola]